MHLALIDATIRSAVNSGMEGISVVLELHKVVWGITDMITATTKSLTLHIHPPFGLSLYLGLLSARSAKNFDIERSRNSARLPIRVICSELPILGHSAAASMCSRQFGV